jgi:hypothetical protein
MARPLFLTDHVANTVLDRGWRAGDRGGRGVHAGVVVVLVAASARITVRARTSPSATILVTLGVRSPCPTSAVEDAANAGAIA